MPDRLPQSYIKICEHAHLLRTYAETTQNTTNGSSKDDLLQQLVGMGFETRQAERALLLARNEEGGMSLNKAVEMCLQGM